MPAALPCPVPGPSGPASPRAILDTQAVLDWLHFGDPRCAAWSATLTEGRWVWVATPAMREELAHVLGRGHLPPALGRSAAEVLERFDAGVQLVPAPPPSLAPPPAGLRCSDRDDQKFIDAARLLRPCWLVSRDRAVLKLQRRLLADCGTQILPPAEWRPEADPPSAGTQAA